MAKGKGKGSAFERKICKQLSEWWTEDRRDDIFWRTAMSGGRATVRGRKGLKTSGQYGDISATDPIGKPLIDWISFELKCGYNSVSLSDLLDKEVPEQSIFYKWVQQASASADLSGTNHWAIIHHRSRRHTMFYFPNKLKKEVWASWNPPLKVNSEVSGLIWGMRWGEFLNEEVSRIQKIIASSP